MRRPALLIAGMILAAGTGLAVSSPASAAVGNSGADGNRWHCHWRGHDWNNWNNDDDWWNNGWSAEATNNDSRRYCHYRRHHHRHHWWGQLTVNAGR